MTTKPLSRVIHALLGGAVVTTTPALAQDAGADSVYLDRVLVTGSRIKRSDLESASPVIVIDKSDIERTGLTSVGALLQDLPVAGAALNTRFNNGGFGGSNLDLRGLGPTRVLILLNGRRFITRADGFVDLSLIPLAAIERIEVLKDGASSIYGSDAIAGVVNIITRDDFEGLQANAYVGQYAPENDGEIQAYDFTLGSVSDRGSVLFNASYVSAEGILAGDRTISREPHFGTGLAFGSVATPQGIFGAGRLGGAFLTTNPGANVTGSGGLGATAFRPAELATVPGGGTDRYNHAPSNYIQTPQERSAIFSQAAYDLGAMRFTVEAGYIQGTSSFRLAPTPLFLGFVGSVPTPIAADNAFNVFGVQFRPSSYVLGRRLVEAGPRILSGSIDNYRFGIGFQGAFGALDRTFDWELSYVVSDNQRTATGTGSVNLARVANALSGQPCRDDTFGDDCVELDLFGGQGPDGRGTITRDMLDYILADATDRHTDRLTNYAADLSGELFYLPAGPLGFAAGYEYRHAEGEFTPDALRQAGLSSLGADQETSGSVTVDEFYLELAVPVLRGAAGAERLDVSISTRYSGYDRFGDTTNSKVGLEWQPVPDLLVRGTFAQGFRAPTIDELFAGQQESAPAFVDPCNGLDTDGDGQPDTSAGLPGCFGVPTTFQQNAFQTRALVGSNPNLEPEVSESYTFGLVYSPTWLNGLDVVLDYYRIDLDDTVAQISAQTIINVCAQTGTVLCERVVRGPSHDVVEVRANQTNIGGSEVEGVDALVSYALPETKWGFFRVVWDAAYQSVNERSLPDPAGAGFVVENNLGVQVSDRGFPRWRANLDFHWSRGEWEATWGMRYLHGLDEECLIPAAFGFCNADADGDGQQGDGRHIGATTYHDVQASYHLAAFDLRVTAGVQNLFDKGPPISTQAFADSYPRAFHPVPGRFPYVRVTVDF